MWWLWIAGPIVAALVYLLTDWRDKRREAEVERWRAGFGPHRSPEVHREQAGYRDVGKEVVVEPPKGPGAKRAGAIPGPLVRMLDAAGGGIRVDAFELVPKLAYFAVMHANPTNASDHQTVVAKLDERAPMLTVRPLALLDGQREPNTGVQFKKDAEFMEMFVVERSLDGSEAVGAETEEGDKAIRKWLSPIVREALMDLPDAWLRVDNKTLALTLYGPADAERLNDLITAADTIFAEYGADGGPSLFGDDDEEDGDPEPAAPPPKPKKTAKKPASGKAA